MAGGRVGASGRARMLAAMDGLGGAEVPVVIPYLGIFLRDHWEELTDVPWWAVRSGDLDTNLRLARDLQAGLGIDWVQVDPGPSRVWRMRHEIQARGGRAFLVNRETGAESEFRREPVGGAQDARSVNRVRSIADIDRLVQIPSADDILGAGLLDCAAAVVKELGRDLFVVGSMDDPFWGMNRCFGLHDMLTCLIERPEWAERALERNTAATLEELRAYARIGVDGIWHECCYTSRDIISLAHFRRFAAPYTERLVRETEALGMRSILYFCGDPSDRIEDLVRMGPTCLGFEEDKKGYGLDIERIDRAVAGRACLFGNVDAVGVLQDGCPDAIGAEIDRQLSVGRRSGRFVMSLGSPVTPLTPVAKVAQFVATVRERAACA